ncbi:MAG TPA: threonine/serine exporter family protein [Anaeromyxobacteraceae bacterium]|nr:threonine/serine exporter family protein [Anaeromyxobacteraceae bacterium]
MALITQATKVLFANGETTERTIAAGERMGGALGYRSTVVSRWDGLTIRLEGEAGPQNDIVPVMPVGIDMNRVMEAERAVDALCARLSTTEVTRSGLDRTAALPPASLARFVLAAAVGAAALSVVFGAEHPVSVAHIALSAGVGALVRRGLAGLTRNLFVQPFCAALFAGVIGGLAQRYQLSSPQALVAICPCMVLVPGPHFLNGLVDLIRARVSLGASRLGFALLVVAAISTGLLIGLWAVGATLPVTPPSRSVALPVDVAAAGFAVFAYTSFYSMPWRQLPLPILAGMAAHALRWSVLALGASVFVAAFFACLFVGLVMTPLGNRLRVPFASLSFAGVVALIPGVFLFRIAAALVQVAGLGEKAPSALVSIILGEGATATLILMAMALGLIAPKLLWEQWARAPVQARNGGGRADGDPR